MFASAPARAASFTVFWDRPDFGFGAGYGVTAATAQSASSAGIPVVPAASLLVWQDTTLPIQRTLDPATLNPPFPTGAGPATITSTWNATNHTGTNNGAGAPQNLYLVFETPLPSTIDVNGQPQSVVYAPSDVGLTLSNDGSGPGVDWVILQVPVANHDPVYYPAVSLGTLADAATAVFPMFYTLKNPQVFTQNFNHELGLPEWGLAFLSTPVPVPEPASGLLVVVGLLGIAVGRRKRR